MEMAKVTSKGQITIPVSIRRRLGINEGDKLLFIDRPEGVMMVNPDLLPGGQTVANLESGIRNSETINEKASKESTQSAAFGSVPGKTDKPAPQVQGLDLNALLNEIRSIGSNI